LLFLVNACWFRQNLYRTIRSRPDPAPGDQLYHTLAVVKEKGYPGWNAETHLPELFNKEKLQWIITAYSALKLNDTKGAGISLYPNPVTLNLTVDCRNIAGTNKDIEICDAQGKIKFASHSTADKVIVNTEAYPVGLYILKVKTENSYFTRQFSKN
jgi:hypothetical protein